MKKIVISILFVLFISINTSLLAFAKINVNVVFPRKEVEKLYKEIDNMPISVDDKGSFNENDYENMLRTSGRYPKRKGVILVTKDSFKDEKVIGHAAIVYSEKSIIESVPSKGVTKGTNDWDSSKKTCYGLSVKGTSQQQDSSAANWCADQIGKPYNWNYINPKTRESFYCSQLVWAAFKDNCGIDLNTKKFGDAIHPLELINEDKVKIIYEK